MVSITLKDFTGCRMIIYTRLINPDRIPGSLATSAHGLLIDGFNDFPLDGFPTLLEVEAMKVLTV